ncbi:hypothetical protein ACH5RR_005599 [Cinchona calisaya]|uniref:Uncharacterized protein n=1 Tax=Cinchona calisaya TaxID=153742 RepID=A0ABD3ALN1_9GENT
MSSTVNNKDAKELCYMDSGEEEEFFEINLEIVHKIPPSHYCESYFTATSSSHTLLANCLLPVTEVSSAVPTIAKACDRAFSWHADAGSFNGFGLQQCDKETKP